LPSLGARQRLGVQQLDQLIDAQLGLPKNREQCFRRNDLARMYGNDYKSIQEVRHMIQHASDLCVTKCDTRARASVGGGVWPRATSIDDQR